MALSTAAAFYAPATVNSFLASGTNAQITRTYYDTPYPSPNGPDGNTPQENLRKRVAATTYQSTAAGTEEQGSYYSYDIMGNVKTLWQRISGLPLKRIDYQYDLVSGKVTKVRYQPGGADQFYYGYDYDAENRLTDALTGITSSSSDGWSIANPRTDAHYQYYLHGPLARVELGHNGVQRQDYAYTLQGWLKGVNGHYLLPAKEMGSDGANGPATFGKDVMALSLDYFNGDYTPIGGTNATAFPLQWQPQSGDNTGQSLFNGNISRSTIALSKINNGSPIGYSYHYDQLNRLLGMRQYNLTNGATSWNSTQAIPAYQEDITYDGNGNIRTYSRNGANISGMPLQMDQLIYKYNLTTNGRLTNNRLRNILDAVPSGNYAEDLDNQADNNYLYDQIGNLTKDVQAGISAIEWNVYGKISRITKTNGSLTYKYDAAGNRVYKQYVDNTTGKTHNTWYVRDAQGNVLAVYGNKDGDSQLYWKEQHLYGSNRLGIYAPEMNMASPNSATLWGQVGLKSYELSNHLGNVLATISDKRTGVDGNYDAEVKTMGDYYPFGMGMPGRKYSLGGGYRYGFNGKENDNEVKGEGNQYDYGFRIYDPRAGKFLSTDPLSKFYSYYTPYQFAGNKPVWATDLDGLEERYYQLDINIGSDNQVKSVSANEIEGMHSGLHLSQGFEGIRIYNTPVGKYGIGDQYSITISRTLTDGSIVTEKSTLFIPRKQTWLESIFSSQLSSRRGGGIIFTSSQAADGIKGASSQNKFEPRATSPDGQMESIDLVVDAISATKNAIEAGTLNLPQSAAEAIEFIKQELDLFDASKKLKSVVKTIEGEHNSGNTATQSDDTTISVRDRRGWYHYEDVKKKNLKNYTPIENNHMKKKR